MEHISSAAGGSFKAGLLVAENLKLEACDIEISRLMGRNIEVVHEPRHRAQKGTSVKITAAYGEHNMSINAGEHCQSFDAISTGLAAWTFKIP